MKAELTKAGGLLKAWPPLTVLAHRLQPCQKAELPKAGGLLQAWSPLTVLAQLAHRLQPCLVMEKLSLFQCCEFHQAWARLQRLVIMGSVGKQFQQTIPEGRRLGTERDLHCRMEKAVLTMFFRHPSARRRQKFALAPFRPRPPQFPLLPNWHNDGVRSAVPRECQPNFPQSGHLLQSLAALLGCSKKGKISHLL